MEKSQIAGKSAQGKHKTAGSRRCLQLCHTKYHVTFSSTYFSKVRDPFPPQTASKISHHKIKYMLEPCLNVFYKKAIIESTVPSWNWYFCKQLHPKGMGLFLGYSAEWLSPERWKSKGRSFLYIPIKILMDVMGESLKWCHGRQSTQTVMWIP